MNKKQEFIEKWGFIGGSRPVFDMRDQLKKDLEEMFNDKSTFPNIPHEEHTVTYYPFWAENTNIDHT